MVRWWWWVGLVGLGRWVDPGMEEDWPINVDGEGGGLNFGAEFEEEAGGVDARINR